MGLLDYFYQSGQQVGKDLYGAAGAGQQSITPAPSDTTTSTPAPAPTPAPSSSSTLPPGPIADYMASNPTPPPLVLSPQLQAVATPVPSSPGPLGSSPGPVEQFVKTNPTLQPLVLSPQLQALATPVPAPSPSVLNSLGRIAYNAGANILNFEVNAARTVTSILGMPGFVDRISSGYRTGIEGLPAPGLNLTDINTPLMTYPLYTAGTQLTDFFMTEISRRRGFLPKPGGIPGYVVTELQHIGTKFLKGVAEVPTFIGGIVPAVELGIRYPKETFGTVVPAGLGLIAGGTVTGLEKDPIGTLAEFAGQMAVFKGLGIGYGYARAKVPYSISIGPPRGVLLDVGETLVSKPPPPEMSTALVPKEMLPNPERWQVFAGKPTVKELGIVSQRELFGIANEGKAVETLGDLTFKTPITAEVATTYLRPPRSAISDVMRSITGETEYVKTGYGSYLKIKPTGESIEPTSAYPQIEGNIKTSISNIISRYIRIEKQLSISPAELKFTPVEDLLKLPEKTWDIDVETVNEFNRPRNMEIFGGNLKGAAEREALYGRMPLKELEYSRKSFLPYEETISYQMGETQKDLQAFLNVKAKDYFTEIKPPASMTIGGPTKSIATMTRVKPMVSSVLAAMSMPRTQNLPTELQTTSMQKEQTKGLRKPRVTTMERQKVIDSLVNANLKIAEPKIKEMTGAITRREVDINSLFKPKGQSTKPFRNPLKNLKPEVIIRDLTEPSKRRRLIPFPMPTVKSKARQMPEPEIIPGLSPKSIPLPNPDFEPSPIPGFPPFNPPALKTPPYAPPVPQTPPFSPPMPTNNLIPPPPIIPMLTINDYPLGMPKWMFEGSGGGGGGIRIRSAGWYIKNELPTFKSLFGRIPRQRGFYF